MIRYLLLHIYTPINSGIRPASNYKKQPKVIMDPKMCSYSLPGQGKNRFPVWKRNKFLGGPHLCSLQSSIFLYGHIAECGDHVHTQMLQLCMTLCHSMDHNPSDSSVYKTPWQEYWSGLPFPPPGALPKPGIKPPSVYPPLAGVCSATEKPGKPERSYQARSKKYF